MHLTTLFCGTLNVSASDMCNRLQMERIKTYYKLDKRGNFKLAMRALLVREEDVTVLVDPGCADFLPASFNRSYGLDLPGSVDRLVTKAGFTPEQITDVVFTHLHFDHGSGAFMRIPGKIAKRFPRARYHVLKEHFGYAQKPRSRESGSFFTALFKYMEEPCWLEDWPHDWMEFQVFNGHTRAMVVPRFRTPGTDTYYLTDLVPMEIFLESGVSSGYDLDPVLAEKEKREFLEGLDDPVRFIFFHDPVKELTRYP